MSNNRYRSNKITLINNPKLLINNKSFPKFEYEGGYGFQSVKFYLENNEKIRANGGSMNYMSPNITISTETGAIFNSVKRFVSGASLFYNIFLNNGTNTEYVQFSGVIPGSISCFYIPKGKRLKVTSESYICSTSNLKIHGKAAFGGVLTGYGLFYIIIEAEETSGLVWLASFGKTLEIELVPSQKIKVDNGVLLALDDSIEIYTGTFGNIKSFFFSGEGIVTNIRNNSDSSTIIYLDSRSRLGYMEYIRSLLPFNKKYNIISNSNNSPIISGISSFFFNN